MSWHIEDADGVLTLCRRAPARFDLQVETVLPSVASRRRLAHQVRQDVWRVLQDLRGFSPVIRVARVATGTRLTAGGRVAMRPFPRSRCEGLLEDLLTDPARRARWVRHAGGSDA